MLTTNGNITADRIATETGVSLRSVQYAGEFVDGMDVANAVLPGVSKDIKSGRLNLSKRMYALLLNLLLSSESKWRKIFAKILHQRKRTAKEQTKSIESHTNV